MPLIKWPFEGNAKNSDIIKAEMALKESASSQRLLSPNEQISSKNKFLSDFLSFY